MRLQTICRLLALAVAAAGLGSLSAAGHPAFQVREAAVGASYRAVISIPHGCEGSPTVKVRVQVPEGVIAVKPMPKPGWSLSIVRGPYARAYPFYHGAQITEGAKEVIWTGKLPDEYYDEFVFTSFLADSLAAGGKLYFPVHQECEKGAMHWTDVPAPGQDEHALKSPAPGVMLLQVADKKAAPQTFKAGALVIETPWIRATPGGAKVAGGYMKITNTGTEPDRLKGGTLPKAAEVEVHEMSMTDNVMKMRRLADGLEIKPGQSVELKPGSYHVMFTGLSEGLKAGQVVKGTLVFEKAGTVEVEYRVAPIGAQTGGGGHQH